MKKMLFLPALLISAATLVAQQQPNALKYGEKITTAESRKHLSILASDEFEGRETGTAGAEKAAAYIEAEFKKLGLVAPVSGSYRQGVPLVENRLALNFKINGTEPSRASDIYLAELFTDREINTEQILFIGYGTDTEIGEVDVRGKVVLWINEDMPVYGFPAYTGLAPSPQRAQILKSLQHRGPALILGVNRTLTAILKKYGEGLLDDQMVIKGNSAQTFAKEPAFVHITDSLANIVVKSSAKTYVQLVRAAAGRANVVTVIPSAIRFSYKVTTADLNPSNVLGYLPGTDLKDELLVFSAHYDHIGLTGKADDKVNNGADDDGSGTTAILEIAKAFAEAKKEGHGPRRSILFLANVGEEKGLLGSAYYTEHPVFPLKNTVANLNIDMIGRVGQNYGGIRDSANYVYLVGPTIMSPEIKQISEDVNLAYDQLLLDYKYDDQNEPEMIFYRSDHYNFAKKGIPVIFYSNGEHADYHKPGDEVNKINFPLLVKRTKLIFYTGWELANRDKRPKAESFKKREL